MRLACFPSMASSDWYTNRPTAQSRYAQRGACKHANIWMLARQQEGSCSGVADGDEAP